MFAADVILVPLEDGDRCEALAGMGKTVIAIDLNPLSRTARRATLTIVDELTRALPNITDACRNLTGEDRGKPEGLLTKVTMVAIAPTVPADKNRPLISSKDASR